MMTEEVMTEDMTEEMTEEMTEDMITEDLLDLLPEVHLGHHQGTS